MSGKLNSPQIRGARALLDWTMLDLAREAGVSVSTVKRMEMAEAQPVSDKVHAGMRAAFEAAGVRFLVDEGEGWGLRLQR